MFSRCWNVHLHGEQWCWASRHSSHYLPCYMWATSNILQHYRIISYQYNQEDQQGNLDSDLFTLGGFCHISSLLAICHLWATFTINYWHDEEIQWNSELDFLFLFAYLIFVWYEPDPPRFAKLTWNKFIIYPILPFFFKRSIPKWNNLISKPQ